MDRHIFQVVLGTPAYNRLKLAAERLDVRLEELFLFLGLIGLKDLECGRRLDYYRKNLDKFISEMGKESKNGQLDEDVRI